MNRSRRLSLPRVSSVIRLLLFIAVMGVGGGTSRLHAEDLAQRYLNKVRANKRQADALLAEPGNAPKLQGSQDLVAKLNADAALAEGQWQIFAARNTTPSDQGNARAKLKELSSNTKTALEALVAKLSSPPVRAPVSLMGVPESGAVLVSPPGSPTPGPILTSKDSGAEDAEAKRKAEKAMAAELPMADQSRSAQIKEKAAVKGEFAQNILSHLISLSSSNASTVGKLAPRLQKAKIIVQKLEEIAKSRPETSGSDQLKKEREQTVDHADNDFSNAISGAVAGFLDEASTEIKDKAEKDKQTPKDLHPVAYPLAVTLATVALLSVAGFGLLLYRTIEELNDRNALIGKLDATTVTAARDGRNLQAKSTSDAELLQFGLGTLARMNIHDLFAVEAQERLKELLATAARRTSLTAVAELPIRLGGGLTIKTPVELRLQKKGRVLRWVCRLPDLRLRLSELRWKARAEAMLEAMLDTALVLQGPTGAVMAVNDQFKSLFDLDKKRASEVESAQVAQLFKDDHSPLNDPNTIAAIVGAISPAAAEMRLRNGLAIQRKYVPVEVDNVLIGGLWAFRDLSRLEKERQALERETGRLRATLPSDSAYGAYILDGKGAFLVASESACSFFGRDLSSLIGVQETALLAPNLPSTEQERAYRRLDGRVVWAKTAKVKLPDSPGGPRFLFLLNDISVSKEPARHAQWQDIPSKPEEWCPRNLVPHLEFMKDFQFKEHDFDQHMGPDGWQIVAGTRRGRSHAQVGKPRDDAFKIATGTNFVILCVSDGAGAAKLSRIASEWVCQTVTEKLRARLSTGEQHFAGADFAAQQKAIGQMMYDSGYETLSGLKEIVAKGGFEVRDFYATYLLAVIYVGTQGTVILTNQVGDGFMAVRRADGRVERQGEADTGGEYSGQVSCFIPDKNSFEKLKSIRPVGGGHVEALILATDGIEDAYFPVETRAVEIFEQFLHGVHMNLEDIKYPKKHGPIMGPSGDAARVQDWLQFEKRGENDDRTIILAWRNPGVNSAQEKPADEVADEDGVI